MTFRKALKWTAWTFAGLIGLLAIAYAGLHLRRWQEDERFETVLVIENLSGGRVHKVEIAHNGEGVYRTGYLDPQEKFALSELNPLRGPEARPRRGDIYSAQAKAAIVFLRDPTGREERHDLDVGGHSDIFRYKCLFVISITPQSVEANKCIEIKSPKRQTRPKN